MQESSVTYKSRLQTKSEISDLLQIYTNVDNSASTLHTHPSGEAPDFVLKHQYAGRQHLWLTLDLQSLGALTENKTLLLIIVIGQVHNNT